MDIEFRHLACFVAVAEERSFEGGAERLRISQTSLRSHISPLESILGSRLFERGQSGVSLTADGRRLLPAARKLLRARDALVSSFLHPENDQIRIGYIAPSLFGTLAETVDRFREANPDLVLEIVEASLARQIDLLGKGEIDLGFVGHINFEPRFGLKAFPLYELPLAVVLPLDHPQAGEPEISLNSLVRERFVGLEERCFPGLEATIAKLCWKAGGFEVEFAQRVDSITSLLTLIGRGQGVALVPHDPSLLSHGQVVFRPFRGKSPRIRFHVLFRSYETRAHVKALIRQVRKLSKEMA